MLPAGSRMIDMVDLDPKLAPSQARGRSTYETILAAAGELLGNVGFERLSTNMVCQSAGLTPPALYRYFPNKYAILSELGRRLMDAQDEAVYQWIRDGGLDADTIEDAAARNLEIMTQINSITRDMPGGPWVLRAMRAVPMLQEIRSQSRDRVAVHLTTIIETRYPGLDHAELLGGLEIITDLMLSATEMMLTESNINEPAVKRRASRMAALYYMDLIKQAPKSD
jgi:AcrR family transcriptional regulator